MPVEVRTPFSQVVAQKQGSDTWRKRLLPVGQIEYKGRVLTFDRRYLDGLAQAFNARAYDQVPFQLADTGNNHTNDPERYRGEVQRMDVQSDGLYVTVKTTPAGNAVLESNPRLGVSARIVEDYSRSDGEYYPVAVQHVLGTLDPRVTGLGPWERVELSNEFEPDMIIDLSTATFAAEATQEGGTINMPELDADQSARLGRLLELDPERLNALLDSAAGADDGLILSEDDLVGLIENMGDEEFAALQAEYDIAPEPQLAGAHLSNSGYGYGEIDLANYRMAELERSHAILQNEHDKQAFINEQRMFTSRHNIPPFITELARPLLEGTGRVVELSNGKMVDSGLVMRQVLQAFGGVLQGLGLDAPVELGTAMDEPDTTQHAAQARADVVASFRNQVGI
jgi:hypothetical protein